MDLKRKLRFYLKNNYNVLLCGKHGTGKTSVIKQLFEEEGLNWLYFSASTMDPWVDFVGVPKERIDKDGPYLDLVLPKRIRNDEVDAIFFDEFNRSKKKVRNAVLEFIQFKEINGRKFNRLKVIWAAINPDDDEEQDYDVERLDPAQEDRFHAKINVPYKLDKSYFVEKYGKLKAEAAIEWWKALPTNARNMTSPRRVDYAIEIFNKNGDIRDVLDPSCNVSKLISVFSSGPVEEKLDILYENDDESQIEEFFKDPNNYSSAIDFVIKRDIFLNKFVKHLPNEKLSSLMAKEKRIFDHVMSNYFIVNKFKNIIQEIIDANSNKTLINKIKSRYRSNGAMTASEYYKIISSNSLNDTVSRCGAYKLIKTYLPKALKNEQTEKKILHKVCIVSLETLCFIGHVSHRDSINRHYPSLYALINSCISYIRINKYNIPDNCKDLLYQIKKKHDTGTKIMM